MHDLHKLKSALVRELEEYGRKGDMSKASLDMVDKLAHAAKNVAKVIESCDGEEEVKEEASDVYVKPDGSYRTIGAHTKEELIRLIESM